MIPTFRPRRERPTAMFALEPPKSRSKCSTSARGRLCSTAYRSYPMRPRTQTSMSVVTLYRSLWLLFGSWVQKIPLLAHGLFVSGTGGTHAIDLRHLGDRNVPPGLVARYTLVHVRFHHNHRRAISSAR